MLHNARIILEDNVADVVAQMSLSFQLRTNQRTEAKGKGRHTQVHNDSTVTPCSVSQPIGGEKWEGKGVVRNMHVMKAQITYLLGIFL